MPQAKELNITEADFDDLIARVAEEGGDPQVVETIKSAFLGDARLAEVDVQGATRRLIIYALRYGGRGLVWLLKFFSADAAQYVERVRVELAAYLERHRVWVVGQLTTFLVVTCGVPRPQAAKIAAKLVDLV
ncbi:hypothetical protein OHS59_00395 [Streptomyces sp. NBC_00414]|uniref:hypothetical protein n=1 Tax=Streptomyces sp. NBC_00414 TaxID=2975739 RepID=UPI002E23AB5E